MDLQAWKHLHALVFPFPEQGHITPLLHLSAQLASRGSTISFVNTEHSHEKMMQSQTHSAAQWQGVLDIRFVTIPDGLPADGNHSASTNVRSPGGLSGGGPSANSLVPSILPLLESIKTQQPVLEKLIEDLRRAAPPVSCLISDAFFPWTGDLAKKLEIPWVVFWSSSATRMCLTFLAATGSLTNASTTAELSKSDEIIPGLPFRNTDIPTLLHLHEPRRLQLVQSRVKEMGKAVCILVNSFEELEGEALHAAPSETPIRSVGPLLLVPPCGEKEGMEAARVEGSLIREDHDCLRWLDTQETYSVLYISFGSKAALPGTQLAKLALGIEASKQPFLWVIRDTTKASDELPEGFLDRTRGRGMIISWAPQLQVLSHRAVGAFLTHCGWNSVMESIVMGVPMLCWAMFADQPVNQAMVEKQWRIGMGFGKEEGGEVEAGEVERVVKEMMMIRREEMRNRVAHLRDAALEAMQEGGSSHRHLEALLHDIHDAVATLSGPE